MRQMYDKLVSDIEELNGRRDAVKAKVAVAKTQDKVNSIASGVDKSAEAMGAFARMEAKADGMLDRSNAMSELNAKPVDEAAALEAKYAAAGSDAAVEDELAKLKAEMGL
ncbi:MAG: PspA/IM30 family protein [Gordonibacter pamelaeae]